MRYGIVPPIKSTNGIINRNDIEKISAVLELIFTM